MQRNTKLLINCVSIIITTSIASVCSAAIEETHVWSFDAPTIEKGYTVSSPDEVFHVGVLPEVLKGETDVTIKVFDHVDLKKYEFSRVGEYRQDDPLLLEVRIHGHGRHRDQTSSTLRQGAEIARYQ